MVLICSVMRSPGRTATLPASQTALVNSPVEAAARVGRLAAAAQILVPFLRTSPTVLPAPLPAVTARNFTAVMDRTGGDVFAEDLTGGDRGIGIAGDVVDDILGLCTCAWHEGKASCLLVLLVVFVVLVVVSCRSWRKLPVRVPAAWLRLLELTQGQDDGRGDLGR